ncbi:MAG TPA: molybdopterin-guanine dinucleotide biosynthesis protein B [Syntrophobacteraceae bacterium]|nr:molybdopterin-guanine dinucleotide biosynthesis protein B [Syntrophobacteraceae bacterium]HBZ56348.1 molybdopterin-guanine dinucleotide biosynthesis protein B [Syntrophobacteraceae bacterium]
MPPIVCIVGASNSGKTTFLEKLIPELVRRGYRIGTVKHDAHGFEMDREGKDTWRHRNAGAQTIAIASPNQTATIRRTDAEVDLEELVGRFFWREDLVLTEGYKRSQRPKIEVFRKVVEPQPICTTEDNLMALVSDDLKEAAVPVFSFGDVAGVADLIETRFLKDRKPSEVLVRLDGRKLPLNDFVKDFVVGTILGMLGSLRGWKKPRSIDIHIEQE